jgi:chloramphenicol 3-O-phosphotransferase
MRPLLTASTDCARRSAQGEGLCVVLGPRFPLVGVQPSDPAGFPRSERLGRRCSRDRQPGERTALAASVGVRGVDDIEVDLTAADGRHSGRWTIGAPRP